ncbi:MULTISPECIES: 60S ribosomal export protein NMD3 [Methanobacterium]|jgi:nonsense-mediated mRNA decay protein 3|uniref:NMD protein affecting ribosome stability and mRNA decay n=1 Tax=Methanobacterium subterraneum TaxID=59277 RepID=A0A2H4VCI9_9EURY|nr:MULTISPECIES: 60S ribosomal export protein NMD3 [Methanobacterium]MBW4258110.1 NMD protein affecting ribosome stability and mRNA decay [Methanobacterium sp. YSL]PKL73109.1 MAG: NMD protein affecting ribosome stability and mRNA decay [Methanobacteriales archaeon HGW-Methanobacteriales-2]AUB55780.1 NMD protein affecting ribosome stability and mRNA decay [Methanobacterium subterraneum]AUB57222.1 NMD protein affecting ribosome stability and mRNA decay [Methanobacterium sp. MZ-A1]AUB60356.1 NMD 
MFCIECGKEDEKLFEGLCHSCFAANNKLISIPPELEVEVCAHCSSLHMGDRWQETKQSEEDLVAETIAKASVTDVNADDVVLEIDLINQRGSLLELLVKANGTVLGVPIEREFKVNVKINRNACPECSKYASGYYEAVLQLRADERLLSNEEIQTVDGIIKNLLEKLSRTNRMAYLSQRLMLKEGVDYYFGSYKAARKISNALKEQMGGMMGESPRLMGRDKSAGKDLYRIWISLRLPMFQKGDFLAHENHIGQVIDLNGRKIVSMDLGTLENISISWRQYDNLEKVASREDVKTTTVTSKSPTEIQLLHPETYQPLDLPMILGLTDLNIGEEVEVIEIKGKLYIIPPKKDIIKDN